MDAQDELAPYRNEFVSFNKELCYLDGNSLGKLPKSTVATINNFLLEEWGNQLVLGWSGWIDEAQRSGDLIARSVLGAAAGQVLACDTTSVNLYQLASAAVRANPGRKTIITDAANFPTDRYILQGIAHAHNMNLVVIDNENTGISDYELISPKLLGDYMSDDVALVSFQVIQYRSGARQNVAEITKLAHQFGSLVLWDAAHAAGSIVLDFDKDNVDLAVGCTYKYGNSGPGAPAWLYVNKNIQERLRVPIQGWFAQRDQFAMGQTFERETTIRGFQIASPSIIGLRCINSAFGMIESAGINNLAKKCEQGTDFMIKLYELWLKPLGFTLLTPSEPNLRGGHITLGHPEALKISIALREIENVIADYRTPNSIRLAISPLYTSYQEIYDGFQKLRDLVASERYFLVSTEDAKVT